ncbi:hypothetical protein HMN09_00975500 [Mycena chlorophos]|uniref:Heme oxygenase n=1 Tax=Mycena chlorophos TaxID=658473 RepID=A0A8H6VZA7_MYCCL|nr:hypothetical protein HMN09_00975500 [Mycena chlorophos]
MSTVVDLSQPLSDVLREGTKKAHEEVEVSPAATAMLKGELDKEEYVRFLMMLWHIYDTFERGLERHQTHPVLEPTYNPTLLARAPHLSADIAHLLGIPESKWKSHRIHIQLTANNTLPPALAAYTGRIQEIADSEDPSALLAHAYVRYLGDLSGGQTIQRALAKAYGLTMGGAGLSFYGFKELRSSKPASIGEMKKIKEWFRAGMNKGAGDNMDVKAAVLEEASRVFDFTGTIFKEVDRHRNDPKSRVILDNTDTSPWSKTYPLSSVLSVILAICIAHFALTTMGFTGERGYNKLLMVEEWVLGGGGSKAE